MKKDVIRIVCFLLTVLLVGSLFVGCGEDEPAESPTDVVNSVVSTPDPVIITTDENDPYEIKQDKDGKDIAILVPEDDGTITLEVAEKTTVEAFLACAVAKEGYAARLTDAKGEEVTDAKALMATGMVFAVVKDGEEEATVSFPIRVISQEAIDNKVDQQQQVESQINQQNPSSQGGTNNSAGNDEDSNAVTSKITLKTVWGSKYTESSAMGKAWQATLENTKKHQKIATDIGSIDPNSAVDLIVKDVMAGKSSVDIYEVSLSMCRNIAKNKAAANLFESKTLNRANVKNGGTDAVTFNNKCYGVALNGTAGAATGIIYNKDLIKKYAPTYDLQALYKANKWDFDAFRTVAKLCTQDTDGDGKTDIYGVTSNTNLIG
ncbi:MAG: hypothetical protein IKM39_00660 [Clostridia bacterium]|nr:hypothetical protein [Clostridia bacterium]